MMLLKLLWPVQQCTFYWWLIDKLIVSRWSDWRVDHSVIRRWIFGKTFNTQKILEQKISPNLARAEDSKQRLALHKVHKRKADVQTLAVSADVSSSYVHTRKVSRITSTLLNYAGRRPCSPLAVFTLTLISLANFFTVWSLAWIAVDKTDRLVRVDN